MYQFLPFHLLSIDQTLVRPTTSWRSWTTWKNARFVILQLTMRKIDRFSRK